MTVLSAFWEARNFTRSNASATRLRGDLPALLSYTGPVMIRALIIGILSAGAFAACSTTPSHPASRMAAAVPASECSTAGDHQATRLGTGACTSEVRSYSAEELRRTGKLDAAHALQMLDPAVTASPP
jgi:hypothetical protein